jgi:hypothetical protein
VAAKITSFGKDYGGNMVRIIKQTEFLQSADNHNFFLTSGAVLCSDLKSPAINKFRLLAVVPLLNRP